MKITSIHGREVLDSRGNPTVEADIVLEDGSFGRGTVPSGASVGTHEAHELRDGDVKRYGGLGVLQAVANINDVIAHDLVGLSIEDQRALDERMIKLDGTANKQHLGANAILAVSIAAVKAAAASQKKPVFHYLSKGAAALLPLPQMNILNGGRHALDSIDFQECMIAPIGAETFSLAMQMGLEVYHALKDVLKEKGLPTTIGDEGGFGLQNASNEDALRMIMIAIEKAGYKPGKDVSLALDIAASEFYENGQYAMKREGKTLSATDMQAYVKDLAARYPLYSIEDPFSEDDWVSYTSFTFDQGKQMQIVGDDLFVTNPSRLQQGIEKKCANAILIKLNQIGTVTETIDTIMLAKQNHYATIISNRSGETLDTIIADLAVALGCGQIKTGAPARSERTAKYNQLLRIEEQLGVRAQFANLSF